MENIWRIYSPYLMLFSAGAFFLMICYLFFIKYLKKPSPNILLNIMIVAGSILWIIAAGLKILSSNPQVKEIYTIIIAFLSVFVPAAWLSFTFHYSERTQNRRQLCIILAGLLILSLGLILTNQLHNHLWDFSGNEESYNLGYLLLVLLSLVFLGIGGFRLFKSLLLPYYIFRWQAFAILIAILFPGIIIISELIFNIQLISPVTLVPFSFIFSTWLLRVTKTRFSVKDIITIARASFFENVADVIIVIDKNDTILDLNPNAKFMGMRNESLLPGKTLAHVYPDLAGYLSALSGGARKISNIVLDHNNQKHFYDMEICPLLDWDSKIISRTIILHDITERKLAEESVRKSEEKFRNIIKQSIDGIVIIDELGCIIEWNTGMEKITGIPGKKVINTPAWEIYAEYLYININPPISNVEIREEILNALQQGNAYWFAAIAETTITHTDGTNRTIQQQTFPIKTSKGYLLGSIIRDITENKLLETERIKSGKLKALGILAGGIAHDFNNILTAITGNLSLAKLFGNNEKLFSLLAEAEAASVQAKTLTYQLLAFAKGGEPIRKTTSIINVIKNAAGFSLRGSNVKYSLLVNSEIHPVDIDIGQMNQVISNLIINANQAMPGGGLIQITVDNIELKKGEIISLPSGLYVKISIMDEGEGISDENLAKIFDPYFSTKKAGNGLGLAITWTIIKRHQGHITVHSIEGVGTSFIIYLKASDNEIIDEEKKEDISVDIKAKILVMDDEPAIRAILKNMLELLGHTVQTTSDGNEAITAYKNALISQEPYNLVIIDLTVPGGMGGKETMEKLLEIDTNVTAIVSSGYNNNPILANYKKYGFKNFLPKPYKLSDLKNVLNSILADLYL